MVANASLENYIELILKNEEDIKTIKNVTELIKNEFISNYAQTEKQAEVDCTKDYEKLLNLTKMSMRMFANSYYKASTFIEVSDIEQIKSSLKNYKNDYKKVNEFKKQLIADLTNFQTQIKTNHLNKISTLSKEKDLMEKQVKVLEYKKHKIVMERLSNILWPYCKETTECTQKIAVLEAKIQQTTQRIEHLKTLRPMANEKEIMMYQMHLKEKYSVQKETELV